MDGSRADARIEPRELFRDGYEKPEEYSDEYYDAVPERYLDAHDLDATGFAEVAEEPDAYGSAHVRERRRVRE